MVNEEISRHYINLEVRLAKATAREVLKVIKGLMEKAKEMGGLEKLITFKGSKVKLKDMVGKEKIEEINLKDNELKELKKVLNKYGVNFSVVKDKESGNHSLFFQSKDTRLLENAFKKAIRKAERKADIKESVKKKLNKFKEMTKDTKEKIRNKEREQSL